MKAYLCIGGPFDGQRKTSDEIRADGHKYVDYNSSSSGVKTEAAAARAIRHGYLPCPSMIWIYRETLRGAFDASANAPEPKRRPVLQS